MSQQGDTQSPMTSEDATSLTGQSQQPGSNYGWRPEAAKNQKSVREYESWLISQAQSYLGKRDVTLEEARELWDRVDINTRKEKVQPVVSQPVGLKAALRALFGMGILLTLSACQTTGMKDTSGYGVIDKPFAMLKNYTNVYKIVDDAAENICYIVVGPNGVDAECMVDFNEEARR